MHRIEKVEWFSLIGIVGLLILIGSAYSNPIVLQQTSIDDLTFGDVSVKLGVLFSLVGLFALLDNIRQSLKKPRLTMLRVSYIILFIFASYCSESNWMSFG